MLGPAETIFGGGFWWEGCKNAMRNCLISFLFRGGRVVSEIFRMGYFVVFILTQMKVSIGPCYH